MVRPILLALFVIFSSNLHGQSTITFQLNMSPLIEKNLFHPEKGEKVFVRGNFNQWNGDDYQLSRNAESNVYRAAFSIDFSSGDSLEYKFIIKKEDDRIYWENKPNPENPDYANRIFVITETEHILPIAVFDYDEFIQYPFVFSKEKLQQDFAQMRQAVEEIHPALYDYTEKETLDLLFDHQYKLIDQNMDLEAFYGIASTVISKIGCGHTKLWIPAEYWNMAPSRLFPLKLFFSNKNKVFVIGSYSDSTPVPVGSELLSINNQTIGNINKLLESRASSDGFIKAYKSKRVEKQFAQDYALCYGYPDLFKIRYIPPGELEKETELTPVSIDEINKQTVRGSELSLKLIENGDAAVLNINTFAYYDRVPMFRAFIDSTFGVIRDQKIENLILDLRGNDGGDPFCSSYLFSYLEQSPVPYFAGSFGHYESLAAPIPLSENHFTGNLFTLIDGSGFSTTGHFCALLKYHNIGKFVGSETGATFTCTGSVRYIDLKNTKLILGTAQKRRYTAAVKNMDRTRGILPDYPVEPAQQDIIDGRDAVLDSVIKLIAKENEIVH
ncbi:hypothetical protein GF337_09410 [candidate division KSB1 bacterium]|nr:hypothetical protein [candidate division KSB1 bacterium]